MMHELEKMTKEQAKTFLLQLNTEKIFNKSEHEAIRVAIKVLEQQLCDDCVSREAVDQNIYDYAESNGLSYANLKNAILDEPSIIPTHGTCKNCKHWKDSDGVYRRGIGAESKCPINNSRVLEGTFYCADFEKRGSENDSN